MSVSELFKNHFVDSSEQIEPSETKIIGDIPKWLKGDLLRNCQAKFQLADDFTVNHFLDGLAMVYKFSFKSDNKVTFTKRFLRTDAYKKSMAHGRPLYTEFGTRAYPDPNKGFLSRILSSFDPTSVTDNSGINIIKVGGELFAASDTCYFRRFERNTLATREKIDLHKIFGVNFACCHIEEDDGDYYMLGTTIIGSPRYSVCVVSPTQRQTGSEVWNNSRILATIPARWKASSSYLHSFAMTERYIVIIEQPYIANLFKLATANIKGKSFSDCMDWCPEEGERVIIVNKKTGDVVSHYNIKDVKCYVHYTNAYEVDDQIVVDIVSCDDTGPITNLFLEQVCNGTVIDAPQYLVRYVIPIVDKIQNVPQNEELVKVPNCQASAKRISCSKRGDHISLSGAKLSDTPIDYFSINCNKKGKPYKYVYSNGGFLGPEDLRSSVKKVNIEDSSSVLWKETDYQIPSEPTFVPNPNSIEEDDGVVLIPLKDTRPDMPHYLIILDAKSMTEVARIETSVPIPHGHHGMFLPD